MDMRERDEQEQYIYIYYIYIYIYIYIMHLGAFYVENAPRPAGTPRAANRPS
jgi:hypothetical protein